MVLSLRVDPTPYPIEVVLEKFLEKFTASMKTWNDQFVEAMKQPQPKSDTKHDRKVLICGYMEEEDCFCVATEINETEYNLDDTVDDVEFDEKKDDQNLLQIQQDDEPVIYEVGANRIVSAVGDRNVSRTEIGDFNPQIHQVFNQLDHPKVNALSISDFTYPKLVANTVESMLVPNKKVICVGGKVFDKSPERNVYVTMLNPKPPDMCGLSDRYGGTFVSSEFTFDPCLASLHTYLGEVDDTQNRLAFLDGGVVLNLPLFYLEGVVLFPEATLPLRVIQPNFIAALERALRQDDAMYKLCRSSLGSIVKNIGIGSGITPKNGDSNKVVIAFQDIFPIVSELAAELTHDLTVTIESKTEVGPLLIDVHDFTAFLLPLRTVIKEQVVFGSSISLPFLDVGYNHQCYGEEIKFLYVIFFDLMEKIDLCLGKVECLTLKEKEEGEIIRLGWCHYLAILKELNNISKLYQGAEKQFWRKSMHRKVSVCYLIIRYATTSDDPRWILEHKEVTNFGCRRHLAMMLLPEVKDEYEELHEMLIDKSQPLAESIFSPYYHKYTSSIFFTKTENCVIMVIVVALASIVHATAEEPTLVHLLHFHANWVYKIHGLTVVPDGLNKLQILHEPIGVDREKKILWNFTFLMFTWKHGFALTGGNSIALKTTVQTSSTSLLLAKTVNIAQVFFPLNIKDDTEKLNANLNTTTKILTWETTNENLGEVRIVFNVERLLLVTVVAMLLLEFIMGLFRSVHQHALHIFVISDWLLGATCTHSSAKDNSWANEQLMVDYATYGQHTFNTLEHGVEKMVSVLVSLELLARRSLGVYNGA